MSAGRASCSATCCGDSPTFKTRMRKQLANTYEKVVQTSKPPNLQILLENITQILTPRLPPTPQLFTHASVHPTSSSTSSLSVVLTYGESPSYPAKTQSRPSAPKLPWLCTRGARPLVFNYTTTERGRSEEREWMTQ